MSSELLLDGIASYYGAEDPPVVHDAVHDMESFFWILLYFALTRTSGNQQLRDLESNPRLWAIVHDIYEGDARTNGNHKTKYMRDPSLMSETLAQMHPYFDSLKPFMLRWWKALQVAYRYRAYEYEHIHRIVVQILEEAIAATSTDVDLGSAQSELKRREEHYLETCKTLVNHRSESAPLPSLLPSDHHELRARKKPRTS